MPSTTPEPLPRVANIRLRDGVARAYWPEDSGRSPPALVVLLHTADAGEVATRLCAEGGVVVLAVHAGSTREAAGAVRWVASHANELDADPGRILIAGPGAGMVIAQVRAWGVTRIGELAGTTADELVAEAGKKNSNSLRPAVEKPDPSPT